MQKDGNALQPAKRYLLKTLGCKANLYDSQLIEAELQKRGWLPAGGVAGHADLSGEELESLAEPVSLCIVNSCTVTDEADRQSRKLAARLSRKNPDAKVVMTGCAAEVEPERLAGSQGIHYVVGNQNKPKLVDLVLNALESPSGPTVEGVVLGSAQNYEQMVSRHPMDREWPTPESSFMTPPPALQGEAGRTRAFLKVQEGCNSFCTYCVIPYGRGPSRSLKVPELVSQVKDLVAQGVREVVITGTNVGDYGTDWERQAQLGPLFEALLTETGLSRLRVSSLDPTEITSDIFALMEREPRFCPHFHVSLQSPHSRILRLMKRKYAYEQVEACLNRIAELPAPVGGAFVGMDVITGFPGETEEEFEWGREALAKLPWHRLHVFPYSEREGTPATRLPGSVPQAERVRRAQVLRELSFVRLTRHYRETLETCRSKNRPLTSILVEGPTRGPDGTHDWYGGYTANYYRVLFPMSCGAAAGKSLTNTIVSAMPEDLFFDRPSGDVAFLAQVLL